MTKNPLKKYHNLFHLPDLDAPKSYWEQVFQHPMSGFLITEAITVWGDQPPPVKSAFIKIEGEGYFAIIYDLIYSDNETKSAYYKVTSIETIDAGIVRDHFCPNRPKWIYG